MKEKDTLEEYFKYIPFRKVLYGILKDGEIVETWTGNLSKRRNANVFSQNNGKSFIPIGKSKTYKKPPLGLMTRDLYEESKNKERLSDVSGAILRYLQDNKPINIEWVEEYNELIGKEVK